MRQRRHDLHLRLLALLPAVVLIAAIAAPAASAATSSGSLTFSNTRLTRPEGGSEPAISAASTGRLAISGLQWLFDPNFFGTHLWTGPFGSTPTFQGLIDASLQKAGKAVFGSGDADIDIGSSGFLHATTLLFMINPTFIHAQLGVSAIRCPNGASGTFAIGDCDSKIIDTAGADRPWITSEGAHVYIAYHDSGSSSLIHIQRSDDDGVTWHRVGDPIVGKGSTTGQATFNNGIGPVVAAASTHDVYEIYAAGEAGIQKATTASYNNIYVSRSSDLGISWTSHLVYHAPLFTSLAEAIPSLAVDPTNGKLYAVWSDAHTVWFSASSDQGSNWSNAVAVNISPAVTAIFPWVAAYSGTVDVVYYGTPASSDDDSSAVWNVYLAQTTDDGASFGQSRASNTDNHVGVICTEGNTSADGTRNMLDLCEVAIDPLNGKAAIAYTDDNFDTDTNGDPLPQIVLAQQN
jgi:hypothetical protein